MTAEFLRTILRQNPQLLGRIAEFNLHPARGLHPDHRPPDLPAALFTRLVADRRGERQLSQRIVEAHGLAPHGCWEFASTSWRVALLGPAELQRLQRWCGAAAEYQAIAALVDGASIRAVKQVVGAEGYEFALRRAPLLAGTSFAAEGGNSRDLGRRIAETGGRMLALCMAGAPAELLRRLALRLPAGAEIEAPDATDDERTRAWRRVRRILAAEFDPEWAPCWN